MLRRTILTTTAILVALGMSACSQPGGSSQMPDQTQPPANPALKIEKPKNLKAISDACQLLTPDQLKQLDGATNPQPEKTTFGEPKCRWRSDGYSASVSLFTTPETGGPAKVLQVAQNPTKVDEYPAGRRDATTGLCRVDVGVADTYTFSVDYSKRAGGTPEMDDPCGYAEKIAREVLKNIPNA